MAQKNPPPPPKPKANTSQSPGKAANVNTREESWNDEETASVPGAPVPGHSMESLQHERELNEFGLQQAELAYKDMALQSALTLLIQANYPACIVETLLAIREDYGFDNRRFYANPPPDQGPAS